MSQKIYKFGGAFPALQRVTETKHRSGLLAVSAEYISTEQDIPTSIPTSIAAVSVFSSSLSKDTSGFVKINATGYGVWSATQFDESFNISVYAMPVYYYVQYGAGAPEQNATSLNIVVESGWIKKIGSAIPVLSRSLTIISPPPFSVYIPETGGFATGSPVLNQGLSMVRHNHFGAVTETEAAYELRPTLNLGGFNLPG